MGGIDNLPPWRYILGAFVDIIVIMSIIYIAVICPLVVRFSMRPKIEKRIGKKLEFQKLYDLVAWGFIARLAEIPFCIGIEYFLSFFNKTTKKIKFFKNHALVKINFDLKDFSKREIFISVLMVLSAICFFGLGPILFFI